MMIGGLEKLTLIDYPGHLAAIIFTQGCNFRCHFCYNPDLVLPRAGRSANPETQDHSPLAPIDPFSFLKERFGRLEGVVITGGEPTLHADLPDFIRRIKEIGYLVKLDTNGTNPAMLRRLLDDHLLDYLAMDIKAPLDRYAELVGVPANCKNIQESVKIIMTSGLPYEFRTTVVRDALTSADFHAMGSLVRGAEKWYLQYFKPDAALVNPDYRARAAYSPAEMEELAAIGRNYVSLCQVRS